MAFDARLICLALALTACATVDRPFPLRAQIWRDADLNPVTAACHREPDKKDPRHVSCAPRPDEATTLIWDGVDNMLFRPMSESLGVVTSGEAVDVNSLDEVPDSSWFTNRIGMHPYGLEQLELGACAPSQLLDGTTAAG